MCVRLFVSLFIFVSFVFIHLSFENKQYAAIVFNNEWATSNMYVNKYDDD